METAEALPAYRAYHEQIRDYLMEIKRRFPEGALLLDIHGQGEEVDMLLRGSRDGLTAKSLLGRFGPAALQGEKSILGAMAAKGYQVHPALNAESLHEHPHFNGGFTVFTYGSQQAEGIDAIQLEFGTNLRKNPRIAEDLADALVIFMTEYGLLPR